MDRLLRPHVTDEISCPHRGCNKCDCYRKQLEEYKDAEEQGLLLRLPCKVGDTVYHLMGGNQIDSYEVMAIEVGEDGVKYFIENSRSAMWRSEKWFDKTVFFTREEAESALAEKGGV